MRKHTWQGQTFWLHPHRLMFWEEEKVLIGSDLHLGKVGHFRKAGIALPQNVYKEDLHRLFATLQYFQPKRFIIVGDLFHSDANKEMEWFLRWRSDLPTIDFLLVKGNHDKLSTKWYEEKGISVCSDLACQNLYFVHDPREAASNMKKATISGHIHPGIRLNGFARQSVQLPCFYFTPTQCILPAFSLFTGLYTVRPQPDDRTFVVFEKEVLDLNKK